MELVVGIYTDDNNVFYRDTENFGRAKMMFRGPYEFLSNFYPCKIMWEGIEYPSTEHAYQASKTLDENMRRVIAAAETPRRAKRLGKSVSVRKDWDKVKLGIMEGILRVKFSQPLFKLKLLNTGDTLLEEGNTWGDTFWGVCNGIGENNLGILLMKIREEFENEI